MQEFLFVTGAAMAALIWKQSGNTRTREGRGRRRRRKRGESVTDEMMRAKRTYKLHRQYCESFWPSRLILVRHGQSEGNVDSSLYGVIPDNQIALTEKGIMQARQAGREIRNIIGDESLRFFYSPYLRAKQTLEEIIREGFADHPADCVLAREEVLLREQDFGNLQDPEIMLRCKAERAEFGRFYYRWPCGESVRMTQLLY